jgi:hypothetical protein
MNQETASEYDLPSRPLREMRDLDISGRPSAALRELFRYAVEIQAGIDRINATMAGTADRLVNSVTRTDEISGALNRLPRELIVKISAHMEKSGLAKIPDFIVQNKALVEKNQQLIDEIRRHADKAEQETTPAPTATGDAVAQNQQAGEKAELLTALYQQKVRADDLLNAISQQAGEKAELLTALYQQKVRADDLLNAISQQAGEKAELLTALAKQKTETDKLIAAASQGMTERDEQTTRARSLIGVGNYLRDRNNALENVPLFPIFRAWLARRLSRSNPETHRSTP